ncbi:zinc finger protein 469 isoform X1 [Kogia breviceps]|uniref:zinc finger protein 469 isoform X1 n=1 Tax=Kogia breviceps TaxID=27615 RepID=UPI0027953DE2|nr:zinc finger protein 469 [Kogia breviceps]
MPGEQPLGAPPPTMTGDLQPCPAASGTGGPLQPPSEVSAPANGTSKATGGGAQAVGSPETQVRQAGKVGPRAQSLSSSPGKGSSPQAPAGRSLVQARARRASRLEGSPQQLYGLSVASSRPKPALDEKTPEGPQQEAPRPPEAEVPRGQGTRARLGPGPPRAEASPGPEELSFQKCFQETPSSFTSTNYTSPSATPGPPPLRAPQSSGASPCRPASYVEFQASRADTWPPAAENSFPGASFGVPPAEPEPFPEGGSAGVAAFRYPFPELRGAGPKAFPEDAAGPAYAEGALAFAFRQPRGVWPEEPVGTGPAYPLPARSGPPAPPCYPSRPGGLSAPSDLGGALPPPGAAGPAPGPFSESTATFRDSLHESVTKVLPERPPSAHDGLGSPRGPPNPLAQRQFPGQAYGSPGAGGVGASPAPRDTELTASGPPAARLPPLWDPAPAPYPTPPLGPLAATTRSAFFEAQPVPGQQLSLPQSPPLPWPQVLPASGPGPHQMEMLNQLPFPPDVTEWQGGSQGALAAAAGKTPGPGEKLAVLRSSPGQRSGGSPGLFAYNGLKDPGAQPPFFGAAQPQASPRGPPGPPPPRVLGASPSESPLPSPATHTASSSCSSLSPLSSSPANPSSDEGQLPPLLGPSAFFHPPPTHPQETGSPFPSPEPSRALPIHYQPEPVKAFPFPTEGLEESPFPSSGLQVGGVGLEGFPQEPPPYPAHHFPLSSASLDQLDVLLTCRQCDRNYSSLAAFLGHRQFCSLLPARATDGHRQPPGFPAPPATPSALAAPKAPAGGTPSPLGHARTAPFLLGGDVRPDGRDDPLRMSFLPSPAAAPFPLPAGDLDLEDAAKLDSLITEALNGLEYQSDNPEIDSSFIDVFTDEEPSGPRGPATGQPPKTRLGATPENKAQLPLPAVAAPLEPEPPRPGDRGHPAGPRPKTRSLGPAPSGAEGAGLAGQQRRGKRFKLFRKELDTVSTAKRPGRGSRASRLRPRRKGRAEPALSRPRDLRAQAPRSHADPGARALLVETRSSRRLRLTPGQDCRRRRPRGGTWSKELIHKIVQQKNRAGRRGPAPGAVGGGPQGCGGASESEEEDGPRLRGSRLRGRPRPSGQRWRRGEKRKEVDVAPGPREGGRQKPREAAGREAARPGASPRPEEPGRPWPGPIKSPEAQGPSPGPEAGVRPEERGPQRLPQSLGGAETPEESRPPLDFPQDTESPEAAEDLPPEATELHREALSSSPATCGGGGPCPPSPQRPRPRKEDAASPRVSSPTPGAPRGAEPAVSEDGEEPPASPPAASLAPVANAAGTARPEPGTLFLKSPGLGDSVRLPGATRGPQPYSSPPSGLFLGPKDLAGCFHEDLGSQSSAADRPPAVRAGLRQDGEDASSQEPRPPGNPPHTVVTGPGKAESPPASERTALFSGLPGDGFEPPVYGSLSGNGDTRLPRACAAPAPRKPQLDPPYPSFLPKKGWPLLQEVSPVLPGHLGPFPGLSGEKAFSQRCPGDGSVAASLPALPGKVTERSTACSGDLSEEELEIKRLVTELESQLQSKGAREAPGEPCGASVTVPGELSAHPEGAEATVATMGGAPGGPQEEWPSFHPGEASLAPGTHKDVAPGCPFRPAGASLSFRPTQKAGVSKTGLPRAEGGLGAHLEVCLPDPPWDTSLAKCSPNPEPALPKGDRATRVQHGQDLPLLFPCPRRGGLSPGSHKAPGPCRDPSELEALGSPVAPLAPGLAFRGTELLPLGATPHSGAGPNSAPKGHSVSSTGGPGGAGLLPPAAGGPSPEGSEEFVPAGASPSRASVPDPSPGRRPQDPASSPLHQLQLLVARAAEREDDTRGSQGPPPDDTQSPQHSDPSDPGEQSVEGGKMARSPARGFPGGVRVTAVPAVAGRQPGPEGDGHPGSHGQAEKPKGQVGASQLQPDDRGRPGRPDQLAGQLQRSRAAVGLWDGARATPGPTYCGAESSVPALAAADTEDGPEDRPPEAAAGPGLQKHLLFAGGSRAPPTSDPASHAPSPTSAATPDPCGPKEGPARRPLRGDCGPLQGPPEEPSCVGVSTPAHGGDCPGGRMARTLEGSRKERPREAPACVTPPHPARATSPRVTVKAAALSGVPTTGGLGAVRGPRAEWPDPRGALSSTHPDGVPKGPSSEPPGNRESHGVTAVPTDPSTRGAVGPDAHTCQEDEAEASPQEQEGLEMPGAGRPATTEASEAGTRGLRATCPATELHPGRTTAPSSTASDARAHSPQGLGNILHQGPQGGPLSPQDPKQKPRGFKKKPAFTENGHWKGGAPSSGQPVTCEVCSASFRSGPGLSRHRARKHGLHRGAASQRSPAAPPAPQTCHPAGKKSRRAPGKEKPRRLVGDPGQAGEPTPVCGSVAPEGDLGPETAKGLRRGPSLLGAPPGCPPRWEPHPPDMVKQGVDMRRAEPRKQDQLERDEPLSKQTKKGGGQRRGRPPADLPSESEGKASKRARKPRARRFREESGLQGPAGVISGKRGWSPSTAVASCPALPSRHLSPEAERETESTQPPLVAADLEERPARRSPGDRVACPGMVEGAPPGPEGPAGRKAASARGCGGPRETRMSGICKEPPRAAGGKPAGDSRVAESRSGQGVWEGHKPPRDPQGPPETRGSGAGGTVSSGLQDPLHSPGAGVREQEGPAPEAPSQDLGDPLSLFDDEASFSQLFPLGDRLARKKNPRVYGKRCRKSKPPPQPEPSSQAGGGVTLSSPPSLPTDLSDSGSLCLSHEDPWGDEAAGLPESFLLEGFLSSKVPGIDPWAMGPSLWALEPHAEADSCCAEDHPSENIPELHMVPAAWRGLELQAPADEATSSPGDASPEPPNLEREPFECGVPGSAVDLQMQELCFLGPCEDAAGLPGASFLDFKATASSQGPQSRTEEAAGARRAPGGGRPTKARRASYKCRVCFQRFHGLGELDLHKLAHSPSPPPTCYMCVERRFGSRELLREHLREKHVQSRAGLWACGMCRREVAGVWMYNEHLREHAVRFARKGQARRSPGNLPGCWEGDGVVAHFLSGIVGQVSKAHRGRRSIGKAGGAPAEASGADVGAGKQFPRERPRPKARANGSEPDSAPAQGSPSACVNPAPPGGESPPPAVPVHQDCKDPARDCHHCGKRFPKPFKLQRHLAVHSPQRVYLCPQCPRVYAEHQELRAHLGGEHGLSGELELQHTPLYACELCANVTHISKRSFVCSSCNYTFAKKEQFDRHMDKHRRRAQQPFTFRGVRRPGAPGHKASAREGSLPSKRRRVAASSSAPGSGVDGPLSRDGGPTLSERSLPALPQPCPEAAPSTTAGQPGSPERPTDPVGHPVGGGHLPSALQELLPPSLSPFLAASADGKDGHEPDQALESSEDEASPGSPGRCLQQALPLEGSLPQPGAGGQDAEEKRAAGPLSGKHRTPTAPGKCDPDHHPEAPSLLWKEKPVSTCQVAPAGGAGGPSHRGSANKPAGCQSSSKDRSASSTSSKAPKFPVQLKKAVPGPMPRELPQGTEDRPKPTTLKVKPGPGSQGAGGPRQGTKAAGGSQPQPASGQLQSETATTPAKPNGPGQGPAPDKAPPRAPAKGYPKGPREAGDLGPRGALGPREDGDSSEKKRKGRAPGPTRSEAVGSLGRGPAVPDKPTRAPRKQATPSRVLPAKPKPSSQNGTAPPQPSEPRKGEPGHTQGNSRRGKEGLGKALPQARPLHRPSRRGGAVLGAGPPTSRACRTAESQSHLLSQLFGQRLTSFKIPLKKDASE